MSADVGLDVAAGSGPRSNVLPDGFAVRLSPLVQVCDGGRTLVGGSRGSALFLRPAVAALVADGPLVVRDPTTRALARRLLDSGMADPDLDSSALTHLDFHVRPQRNRGGAGGGGGVTVVVPVRDRAFALDRLLRTVAELDPGTPVVVVDDASRDPRAVARVAHRHGARLVTHTVNRGPAAARNSGLAVVGTPSVVFCDSDVVPTPGWLDALVRHLADPVVALVAPRVLGGEPDPGDTAISRYEQVRSSLDLGPTPAAVRPATPVSYVPSACLAGRVEALRAVGGGFDERLRVAEDVDLVWRLVAAGWTARYEPRVEVRHDHRSQPRDWLLRKAFYGTGAAPLARRHGPAVAPMVLAPWSAVAAAAMLAQRRWSAPVALGAAAVATARLRSRLGRADRPWTLSATLVARGAHAALTQTGQSLVRHHWPLWLAVSVRSPRVRRALLLAVLLDGARDPARRTARLSWPAWMLLRRLDDAAYGAGVWWGCWRHRSASALLPSIRARSPSSDPKGRKSGSENLPFGSLDARAADQSPPSGATTSPDSSQTQTGSGPPRSGWM